MTPPVVGFRGEGLHVGTRQRLMLVLFLRLQSRPSATRRRTDDGVQLRIAAASSKVTGSVGSVRRITGGYRRAQRIGGRAERMPRMSQPAPAAELSALSMSTRDRAGCRSEQIPGCRKRLRCPEVDT